MAMLASALKHGQNFAATYKPNTAVSDWVERLCSSSYKVTEYEGIPELVESINLQHTGPGEAARMLRKKLKYGNTHMQLRAIFLLKCLVENCGERTNFQRNFPDATLVDRLKIIAGDPQTDPIVKKTLMATLKGFHSAYHDDRSMRIYAEWWDEVGGARGEADEKAKISYQKERERLDKESQLRLDEKFARRLQGEEDDNASKLREAAKKRKEDRLRMEAAQERMEKAKQEAQAREEALRKEKEEKERAKLEAKNRGKKGAPASQQKRIPFNFEQDKPKIAQAVATASMYANGLVNALQHVNREQESVASNSKVQDQLTKLKESRRSVVRYIQLCEVDTEGEYIGMLISSNDQIIAALQLYDRMLTKPADEDSDDEPEQATAARATNSTAADAAASHGAQVQQQQQQPTIAVSPSPNPVDSAASGMKRMTLERNASLASFGELDKLRDRQRTEIYRENNRRGLQTPGLYGDLQGLNFSVQEPIQPQHATETRDRYDQGNLSDYSDYSSDDEAYNRQQQQSASNSGNRAWKDFVDEHEAGGNLLGDSDDPFGDSAEVATPVYEKPRAHVWAEI